MKESRVDLVDPGARRLALVELASDSEELVASVQPIGGRAVVGDRVVALDTCTAPIAVRFRPEQVHPERCHAVIHLALAASLADAPLQPALLALLPSFTLHF